MTHVVVLFLEVLRKNCSNKHAYILPLRGVNPNQRLSRKKRRGLEEMVSASGLPTTALRKRTGF